MSYFTSNPVDSTTDNNATNTSVTSTVTNSETNAPNDVTASNANANVNVNVNVNAQRWVASSAATVAVAPDALDPNDDFDSDQLDEDESYSWASTDNQDMIGSNVNHNSNSPSGVTGCSSSIPNWRDWKSIDYIAIISRGTISNPINFCFNRNLLAAPTTNRQSTTAINYPSSIATKKTDTNNSNNVNKLVDLCAKYVASNIPFELVECYREPVPEDLQLKITYLSFPNSVENIRMYSCLANGNVDEFMRGEQLYRNRCVHKIIQIGFHLSAQVVIGSAQSNQTNNNQSAAGANAPTGLFGNFMSARHGHHNHHHHHGHHHHHPHHFHNYAFTNGSVSFSATNIANVAIVCDRNKIISCSCTCSKQPIAWCSHTVAVALYRILEAHNVEFRAPVSESLSKLKRDQLQKFAQYLISELPQQVPIVFYFIN